MMQTTNQKFFARGVVALSGKKIAIVFSVFLLFSPYSYSVQAEEQAWIIEMEDAPEEIEAYISKYHPFLEVLYTYETLIDAVAVRGKEKHIEALYQEHFVTEIHAVQQYTVPENSSPASTNLATDYHPEN